jgi:hypothetical protein
MTCKGLPLVGSCAAVPRYDCALSQLIAMLELAQRWQDLSASSPARTLTGG